MIAVANFYSEANKASLPWDIRVMNVLAAFFFLAAIVGVLWFGIQWALKSPAWAIKKIVIDGDTSRHNELTLKANLAGKIDGHFLTTDLKSARTAFTGVPWVRQATVRREFPAQLRVRIEEHRSVAFWGADTETRLVNAQGEVFEINAGDLSPEEISQTPRLIGANGRSPLLLKAHQVLSEIVQIHDLEIDELELSQQELWRARLDNGTTVQLGRGGVDEISERMRSFLSTKAQVLATYQRSSMDSIHSVDLRHATGYAIRLQGVTTHSEQAQITPTTSINPTTTAVRR